MFLNPVSGRNPLLLLNQGQNSQTGKCSGHRCTIVPPHMIHHMIAYFQGHMQKYHDQVVAVQTKLRDELREKLAQSATSLVADHSELHQKLRKAESIIAKAANAPEQLIALQHYLEEENGICHRGAAIAGHADRDIHEAVSDVVDTIEQAPVIREISDLFRNALGRITGRTSDSSSSSSAVVPKPEVSVRIFNLHEGKNLTQGTKAGKEIYSDLKGWDLDKIEQVAQIAYNNTMNVLRFWKEKLGLHSFDNHNHEIDAVIHYMKNYANAFFEGERMVYGDGNYFFDQFVNYLDVAGHEMWHAVTPFEYQGESGALNEHYSDVFGAAANMFVTAQDVHSYHWLVGKDLVKYAVKGQEYRAALRSFIAPGTAYANVKGLGSDPQPATYDVRYQGDDDNGGVHINSGIANNAFYQICKEVGELDRPLQLWFNLLRRPDLISKKPTFTEFANGLIKLAAEQNDQKLVHALVNAWTAVKVPFNAPHATLLAVASDESSVVPEAVAV